jgi:hypothetical protein
VDVDLSAGPWPSSSRTWAAWRSLAALRARPLAVEPGRRVTRWASIAARTIHTMVRSSAASCGWLWPVWA